MTIRALCRADILLGTTLALAACSGHGATAADGGAPLPDASRMDASGAPDASGGDGGQTGAVSVPIRVVDYPGGGGKLLTVTVSIHGSAPVDLLLDTGSSGLRVLASALGGADVGATSTPMSADFGGIVLQGRKASAPLRLGDTTTSGPVDFQLIDDVTCAAGDPSCDPSAAGAFFSDMGTAGILGVGLRTDPSGIYSPLAQLDAPLSDGFTVRTGGLGSSAGELVLGQRDLPGATPIALMQTGTLPNAVPAWADDGISICYQVASTPTDPPCTASVFDTGSNLDVLYAPGLPAGDVDADGFLASGVRFEATEGSAFHLDFTVGTPVTFSLDGVLVEQDDPFTILGVEVFLRYDVAFDLVDGRIALRAL